MVYRKTERVLAQLETKRVGIIVAAIDVIAKTGLDTMRIDQVAARGGIANGSVYKYFADKTELVAAVIALLLARDLGAIRQAVKSAEVGKHDSWDAFVAAIAVFYDRMESPHVVRALAQSPAYTIAVRNELAKLLRPVLKDYSPNDRTEAASGVLGAIFGFYDVNTGSKNNAPAPLLFVLRGIGLSDREARKLVQKRYSKEMV